MDAISILQLISTFILGGGLVTLVTLRARVKREEFEVFEKEIERLNSQLVIERERNKELMSENIARAKDKSHLREKMEATIEDKVQRLREAQNREHEANVKLADSQMALLTETKAHEELKRRYDKHRCHDTDCVKRRPPTDDTLAAIAKQKEAKTTKKP